MSLLLMMPYYVQGLCKLFYIHDFIYSSKPDVRFKLLQNTLILEAEPDLSAGVFITKDCYFP